MDTANTLKWLQLPDGLRAQFFAASVLAALVFCHLLLRVAAPGRPLWKILTEPILPLRLKLRQRL